MQVLADPWAVVLAAGEGTRLRALTTDGRGNSIPKQFSPLIGDRSLLQFALQRAAQVVAGPRTVTIVAADHEPWWKRELGGVPRSNVVVQPANRGTAAGVLLPLLRVLERDPDARVVVLPSDHFVACEEVLARSVHDALVEVRNKPERLVLLGIVPDAPDPDLGWIVPRGSAGDRVRPVSCFKEKPPAPVATRLMCEGGLWNSFIFAAAGRTLVELFELRLPALAAALGEVVAGGCYGELEGLYRTLPVYDFCRDVLQGLEERLSVLAVPRCGWSDLGTPARVMRCGATLHPHVLDRAAQCSPPLPQPAIGQA